MDKWLYGYWFKSKKKTFGWGWTIIPSTPQGYILWGFVLVCCVLFNFPEMLAVFPQQEVKILSIVVLVIASFITFVKTDLRDDE